jgi:beta-glucanase (GH16 family)
MSNGIVFALVAFCAVSLAASATAQEPDTGGWQNVTPDTKPVKRITDKYPLSDQQNRGGWVRYEPMWDEFDGDKLDPAKWHDRNPGWKGRQPAWFSQTNVTVSGGKLNLTMRKEDTPEDLKGQGYHTYSSAAVQSAGTVLYGYFEVKAKAMRSAGSSAFWFYKSDPDRWTEIDVFEIGGRAPGKERNMHITVHVMHTPTIQKHFQIGGIYIAPADLDEDYHVYGLEWDAKELKFYFDGALVRKGPNNYWHQPLTLNFDSETMPDWFGLPKDQDLPSAFRIEYVRAWKKKG